MDASTLLEIELNKAFCGLSFGSSMQAAEQLFGKPEEVELMDDIEDCLSTLWHYWDLGFTLFFDENDQQRFCCVEVRSNRARLWGKDIFHLKQDAVITLFKEHQYAEFETEQQDWGEHRLSYDDANVDFYFMHEQLSSLNFSKSQEAPPYLILPN